MSLEGALGKIAVTSVRNPKQSLQIETPSVKTPDAKLDDPLAQLHAPDSQQQQQQVIIWLLRRRNFADAYRQRDLLYA